VLSFGGPCSYRDPVRAEGLLTEPAEAAHADHVCWVYADADDLAETAHSYLEAGLARGERLLCIGEPVLRIGRTTGPLADVDGLRARGTLQVLVLEEAYRSTGTFTREEQLAFYEAATRAALQEGYSGLRVVAAASALAGDPADRAELLRWEHLADDFIASRSGMMALCAYRADLDGDALADMAAVHPLVHIADGDPPFRVWFDGGTLAVSGALDTFGADRLQRVLTGSHVDRPVVVLDLSRAEFVDVGGCRTLALWARRLEDRGARLELVGTSGVFRRMWDLLGFDELADVSFREPPA
jgi:anti-anti-sigma regulatory factor